MPNALVMTGKFRTHIQDTCLIANTFLTALCQEVCKCCMASNNFKAERSKWGFLFKKSATFYRGMCRRGRGNVENSMS